MKKPEVNILVADTDPREARLLAEILSEEGYRVFTAQNKAKIMAAVRDTQPALMLLTIPLPGGAEFELCEQLRAQSPNRKIPTLILVNPEYPIDKQRFFELGVVDIIVKPLYFQELLTSIQTQLNLQDLITTLAEKETALEQEIAARKELETQLAERVLNDPLTRVYNRRYFFELAQKEMERARRNALPLCLVLLNVDQLQKVNDTHGHIVGDRVLINLAKLCKSKVRDVDVVARYDSEEFVILMPDTLLDAAQKTAERLRQTVFESFMAVGRSNVLVTISLGIASWDGLSELEIQTLLQRAEEALKQSKKMGRNCTNFWREN